LCSRTYFTYPQLYFQQVPQESSWIGVDRRTHYNYSAQSETINGVDTISRFFENGFVKQVGGMFG
jgi:hypothetical protein